MAMTKEELKRYQEEWRRLNPHKIAEYRKKRKLERKQHREEAQMESASEPMQPDTYRSVLQLAAIRILGGKCAHCGFDDVRAMQIDHIEGGGTKQNKDVSWSIRYSDIIRGESEGLQLLCANCNWIKRYENREATGRPRNV